MPRGDDAYRDLVGRGPVEVTNSQAGCGAIQRQPTPRGLALNREPRVQAFRNAIVGRARTGGLSSALLQLRAVRRGSTERDAIVLSEARSFAIVRHRGVNNAMKWS
jgi:hypothetical protein